MNLCWICRFLLIFTIREMQTAKPSYCAKNAKNVNVQKFTEHPVRCGMAQKKKHINSMDLSTEQANYSNLQRTTVRLFYEGTDWCFSCTKCFDSSWLRRNHPAGQGILPILSVSIARGDTVASYGGRAGFYVRTLVWTEISKTILKFKGTFSLQGNTNLNKNRET